MQHLLPPATADNANLEVAHGQLTAFSADWLHLQVTTDRFTTDTAQAPHVRVRDLVVRVFGERLHHTPVKALGINRRVHLRVQSVAERDRIGRALAPVESWGRWREELDLDGKHGGMTSLRMSQLRPEDRPQGGSINITVEPSKRIADGSGVFVEVNDHYAAAEAASTGAAELMAILNKRFDESISRSDGIINHIMSLAKEPEES